MSELSSQFGPINPKGMLKLSYGDFVGSDPNDVKTGEFPLDLNVVSNPLLDRCLIVAFFENARYTLSAVEILNSFNTQKSGVGVIFGWVNLTEDSRIVNNLINNDLTRKYEAPKYRLMFPPYFIIYNRGKAKGFFNVGVFSVDGIYEQLKDRVTKGMCIEGDPGGADPANVMSLGPGDNLVATLSPEEKPELYNLRTKKGGQAFVKQLQGAEKRREEEAKTIQRAAQESRKSEQQRQKIEQEELNNVVR